MDGERKVNLSEGVPLNSSGAANIFLNAGKKNKLNDGTVIHLNTEKPADVGVHINTTFSIASSKKIKLLFVLNFLLSVICMIISCSIAFYYWNELISMRRQLDVLRDHFLIQNLKDGMLNQDRPLQSPLVSYLRPPVKKVEHREGRSDFEKSDTSNARRYYVEDLGEDMLLVDSSKKSPSQDMAQIHNLPIFQKESLIVHFNGHMSEHNLGTQAIIGPWVRDLEVSTKNSETKIELNNNNCFTIKENGLYLIYTQVVYYLAHAPNCYFVWARQPGEKARLLSTCATGDINTKNHDRSEISCSVQTIAKLNKGDVVNLSQREHNRTLWLSPGYTYFGFLKLSS